MKLAEIKRKKYRESHPEGVFKHQKQQLDVLKKKRPLRSMAGERPVLQQHQTRAGGTVIMLNEHFLF